MVPLSRGLKVCLRSRLSQAFRVITQRLVQFRAQRVRWDSPLELLQGAVESTTTWDELILHRTEIGESGAKTNKNKETATVDQMSGVCVVPGQHKTLWQRLCSSVCAGRAPELNRQQTEAISCQKYPEPSDRASEWCHVQSTKTTSCWGEFERQTMKTRQRATIRALRPAWFWGGALHLLFHVAEHYVQEGSHRQL